MTQPAESSAIRAYRAAREKRLGELGEVSVDDMLAELEQALCAAESGARTQFYLKNFVPVAAVDTALRLESAMRALGWLKERPVLLAIKQIRADRAADKERRAYFGAKKREATAG